jgi:hypothetical protein
VKLLEFNSRRPKRVSWPIHVGMAETKPLFPASNSASLVSELIVEGIGPVSELACIISLVNFVILPIAGGI